MRSLILFAILLGVALSANWAVLVAGSAGYSNYRHQADVYHAYQTLVQKGFLKQNIILMAHDDIAHNLLNPHRGQVYNKPTFKNAGVDVYAGVAIDYRGTDVKPDVFLAVLAGNKTHVAKKGTGRVLESTSADNVFIFFSDHGAPGLIAFPNQYLYAKDLLATFSAMQGRYAKLVFYLEACESGSMFVNLPKNTKIYALSAASTDESSWATYCSPDDVVGGKHINSCLGDLFSVSWLEDTDAQDVSKETLDQQFQIVRKLTTQSKVLQWGDTSFTDDVVGAYVGNSTRARIFLNKVLAAKEQKLTPYKTVSTYQMKLNYVANLFKRNPNEQTTKDLIDELNARRATEKLFGAIRSGLNISSEYNPATIDFDCYKHVIDTLEARCGKVSEYGLKFFSVLVNVCDSHSVSRFTEIIQSECRGN